MVSCASISNEVLEFENVRLCANIGAEPYSGNSTLAQGDSLEPDVSLPTATGGRITAMIGWGPLAT